MSDLKAHPVPFFSFSFHSQINVCYSIQRNLLMNMMNFGSIRFLISVFWVIQTASAKMKIQTPPPLIKVGYTELTNVQKRVRSLETSERPLKIKFHTQALESALESQDEFTKVKAQAVIDHVLPTISDLWSKALSITPSNSNMLVPKDVCYGLYDFPEEWSESSVGLEDTDLLIFVSSFSNIENQNLCEVVTSSTLAVSAPCAIDTNTERPVIGFANICPDSLVSSDGVVDAASIREMVDVISHEVAHILGINSDLFKFYRNSVTGEPLTSRKRGFLGLNGGGFVSTTAKCVDNRPDEKMYMPCSNTIQYREEEVKFGNAVEKRSYYEIVLPTVVQVVRNQFNCQRLTGARLENHPTRDDCIGSHFDERQWFSEFMSAVYDKDSAHLSSLTLAILEDSGWYKVNYEMAENSPFGLGAGCDFVEKDCIVDGFYSSNRSADADVHGVVPDYGKGYFCDDVTGEQWSCGPSRNFRGKCDLNEYENPERPYFDPPHIGPSFIHADFCPMVITDTVDCNDTNATKVFALETFSPNSNCVDVSVGSTKSAMCLAGFCNHLTHSYAIQMGTKVITCTEDFEVKQVDLNGFTYRVECPRLTQVCPE